MTTPALAAALMIPSVADRFVFVNAVVAVAPVFVVVVFVHLDYSKEYNCNVGHSLYCL